jgi:hypothetical protein
VAELFGLRACEYCGREYERVRGRCDVILKSGQGTGARFCSLSCSVRSRGLGYHPRKRLGPDLRSCQHCGRQYERARRSDLRPGRGQHTGRRFCSRRCAATHTHPARPMTVRTCERCGILYPCIYRRVTRFCSRNCANRRRGETRPRSCERCGRVFTRKSGQTPANDRYRFCTRKCAAIHRFHASRPAELDEPIARLTAAIEMLRKQ